MATLSISEYQVIGRDMNSSPLPIGREPAVAVQSIKVSAKAAQSDTFGEATHIIRVVSDVDCRIAFGSDPKATDNSMLLPAGAPEYFGVQKGHKLSVVEVV